LSQSTCPVCGDVVLRRGATGPVPTYCSRRCRSRVSYLAKKAAGTLTKPPKPPTERSCEVCAGVFTAKRSDARFCSEKCAESVRGCCSANGCDRGVRARGMCAMHWRRWARAEGREVSVWDDRRRNNYHRRRAREQGSASGSRAFLADVLERDGSSCSLCGESVDLSLTWPDQLSKSIDHVVPLSKGGSHDLSNCRLAHLGCNVRKGNRAA